MRSDATTAELFSVKEEQRGAASGGAGEILLARLLSQISLIGDVQPCWFLEGGINDGPMFHFLLQRAARVYWQN